jgi:putative addiction module component (TIGR02574 family)
MSKDEVFRAALALPQETRAELADRLYESLEEGDQEEIDRLWAREAEARIAALERGEMRELSAEEVFSSLRFRGRE